MRSNLDILLEVLKAFVRAVDADDVVDEEHAGRLVAVVSFYFRRNHAVCLVIRRMIFLWSSSSSQLSYYLVRLRATVVLAAGAHVPVARAPVVHVLMSFSIVPRGLTTTMWCLPIVSWLKLSSTQRSIQRRSGSLLAAFTVLLLALLPLRAGKWVCLATCRRCWMRSRARLSPSQTSEYYSGERS